MTVALISGSPGTYLFVEAYPAVPNPLVLPNGEQVEGASVGWSGEGYALVTVTPFSIPTGYITTGNPTYSINTNTGAVGESYSTIPTPPALVAQQMIAAGIGITSISTPALNGTYAIDPASQGNIVAVSAYIGEYGTFPNNQTTLPYPDSSGAIHTFPSITEWAAFAKAVADYVEALEETANILAAGGSASWPVDATIP